MLRTLNRFIIEPQKVRFLKRFKPEKVIRIISLKIQRLLQHVRIFLYDFEDILGDEGGVSPGDVLVVVEVVNGFREAFLGFLVEIVDGDSRGEETVLWVDDIHVGAGFRGEVV